MASDSEEHYLKKELYDLIKKDESTFDFIQNASLDGLWYWDLDSPAHEWMNPKFWTTLGIDYRDKKHLASEWQDLINPDDFKVVRENFERHLADENHPYDQIVRYTHANGSTVWVRCRGIAIRDENGKPIRMLGAHNDITKQMEMEARYKKNLAALDELYAATKMELEESHSIFNASPDTMLQIDTQGYIVKANLESEKLFGYRHKELIDMSIEELVPKSHRKQHIKDRNKYIKEPSTRPMGQFRKGIKARHKNGELIPVEIRLSNINTRFGKQVLATIRDVSEQQALIASLKKTIEENELLAIQAYTDPLTGLKNRRYFDEYSSREFSNCQRYENTMSIMMIDIDKFKEINDLHGHDVGDEMLKELSSTLSELIRSGDIIARIGGEEFSALLPATSLSAAEALAERMRYKVEELVVKVNNLSLKFTISIGVAELTLSDSAIDDVIKRADNALYDAKNKGRNRVESA